jgi:hypothetical protein
VSRRMWFSQQGIEWQSGSGHRDSKRLDRENFPAVGF